MECFTCCRENLRRYVYNVVYTSPFQFSVYGGYTLALKRNSGHAGAQTAIDMMASEIWQGGLKSRHVVARFEAKVGDMISNTKYQVTSSTKP